MRAFAFTLALSVLLLSTVSAFANSLQDLTTYSNNVDRMMIQNSSRNAPFIQQWVGKSDSQLVKSLGNPNYISNAKPGREVYNYIQEAQRVGPVDIYQFVVGRNGKVVAANEVF